MSALLIRSSRIHLKSPQISRPFSAFWNGQHDRPSSCNNFLSKCDTKTVQYRHVSMATTVIEKYGSLANDFFTWIANLPPTVFIQDTFCYLHDDCGISWWACIIGSSLVLRIFLMVPAQIVSQKTMAKRVLLKEEMDTVLIPALKAQTDKIVKQQKLSKKQAEMYFFKNSQHIYKSKVIEYNCASTKIFIPILLQVPVWIFTTAAIRNLIYQRTNFEPEESLRRLTELSQEGCLWFTNLVTADPTYIIPVLVGASFFLGTEISSLQFYDKHLASKIGAKQMAIRNVLWRLVAISMGCWAAYLPTAVTLYWVTSGTSAVAVNLMLMSPKMRRLFRIPQLKTEEQKPYRKLVDNFIKRLDKQKQFVRTKLKR